MKHIPVAAGSTLLLTIVLVASSAMPVGAQCDHFRRGDANGDGTVDLSDAVNTLFFLFAGIGEPACLDAADADDSGDVRLTDSIFTLAYLFRGSEHPPAPGPAECGRDETFDDLTCFSQDACDPAQEELDFSGFAKFSFEEVPALGFCGEVDKVAKAVIAKNAEGGYDLELAVLREGTDGVDECLHGTSGEDCLVLEDLPPRDLTAQETGDLLGLFSRVRVRAEHDWICECIAIDPCRIGVFQWDEFRSTDFLCSPPYLPEDQGSAIDQVLESLRRG